MQIEQRLYFRDSLRAARDRALQDAEAFGRIILVLERLGHFLVPDARGLAGKLPAIANVAAASPLAAEVPATWPDYHTHFVTIAQQLRHARNAAIHDGAFARHITSHAVLVSLVIEDALMSQSDVIGDYMVRMPTCACAWHPLSFVRQTLLANSFSFLPVDVGPVAQPAWRLISDQNLATFLRNDMRNKRLAMTLEQAVETGLELLEPYLCAADTPVQTALTESGGLPILVVSNDRRQLLGIATAFDVL